eukprot:UN30543
MNYTRNSNILLTLIKRIPSLRQLITENDLLNQNTKGEYKVGLIKNKNNSFGFLILREVNDFIIIPQTCQDKEKKTRKAQLDRVIL